MAEHANTFLLVTILVLVTILLVFGMKYFSAARQVRLRVTTDGAYRELAQQAIAAQDAGARSLALAQGDLSDIKSRLVSIEKMLREVE
jgi:signal transduction histidine kinase